MRGFSYWGTICKQTGGHRKAWEARHGRICPGDAVPSQPCCPPARLPLGAAEGVMVSQPASDFGSAPEGLAASQMCRICNGVQAGRQDAAQLVHFLMYIWAREKMLPLTLLPGGHRAYHPATRERAAQGRQHLIGHPSDTRELGLSPCLSSQAPVPAPLQMPCSRFIPGITSGRKKKTFNVKPRKPKDVNVPLNSRSHQSLHREDTRDEIGRGLRFGSKGQRLR